MLVEAPEGDGGQVRIPFGESVETHDTLREAMVRLTNEARAAVTA